MLGREPRLSPSGLEAEPAPAPALVVTGPSHVPCLTDAPSPVLTAWMRTRALGVTLGTPNGA